jgi:hypothetical protein
MSIRRAQRCRERVRRRTRPTKQLQGLGVSDEAAKKEMPGTFCSAGCGHLDRGRFQSIAMPADEHRLAVWRSIERNPLRANLVRRADVHAAGADRARPHGGRGGALGMRTA